MSRVFLPVMQRIKEKSPKCDLAMKASHNSASTSAFPSGSSKQVRTNVGAYNQLAYNKADKDSNDNRYKQAEESLWTVMYLSYWGPNWSVNEIRKADLTSVFFVDGFLFWSNLVVHKRVCVWMKHVYIVDFSTEWRTLFLFLLDPTYPCHYNIVYRFNIVAESSRDIMNMRLSDQIVCLNKDEQA